MIHAYDKSYLSKAQATLANMLDFGTRSLKLPLKSFYQLFLASSISQRFSEGDPFTIAGKSGIELALELTGQDLEPEHAITLSRSPEYWTGWALAYFQWYSGMTFQMIEDIVPITEIHLMYNPYHEMDITQFCDRMLEVMKTRASCTNLKRIRMLCGYSQSDLAERSGIALKTLQMYEQRLKNINCAKAETVIRLSRALSCRPEDLMEL